MDDDGDIAMSGLPIASRNAASSPLSSARTLTTPGVSLAQHTSSQDKQSAFIDLVLSDPVGPPDPFLDGKKALEHSRDTSKVADSTAKGESDQHERVIGVATILDDDLQYDPLERSIYRGI
jgi:hypothetical protein